MERVFLSREDTPVVKTDKGRVRGYCCDGISIFKGIPYAKARRFHAPEPVEAWEGVLDADSYGYVCPLLEMPKPQGELLAPHRYWLMDENCQNLNIWTPGCDAEKRPVLVWLHGGGYEAGSAIEQEAYDGEAMSRLGQVVVVSINHRLNILGYCDLSEFGSEFENSGNAGMDDIVAALQWVHCNISRFGGDPENVTIFGQSGGGGKVTTLLQMPAADGLYQKGIIMSGVLNTLLQDSIDSGSHLAHALIEELHLADGRDLETVPFEELKQAFLKVKPRLEAQGIRIAFSPHPNASYMGDPAEHGFRQEAADIPLLVGSVLGEFSSFLPGLYNRNCTAKEGAAVVEQVLGKEKAQMLIPLFEKAYPDRNPVDLLLTDFAFRLPTQMYIRQRSAINPHTYSYLFHQDMPLNGGQLPWHCADIPFVFHNTRMVPATQIQGVTEKLEEQIFESVMAFARTGDPGHEGIPDWTPSTPEQEWTMLFGEKTELRCNHDAQLIPLLARYMGEFYQKQAEENQDRIVH